MTSSKIEALKREKQKQIKKKNSQIPHAVIGTLLAIFIYCAFKNYNVHYSSYWFVGILIGITMRRSRFCFAAGFRDPILVGSTSLLKAILLSLILSTIGFFIIQYNAVASNSDYLLAQVPGQLHPVGLHTALGAILFGAGMVVAGGCASGVLMRVGEGYMMQLVVLLGFMIGSLLGARHFPFWDKTLVSKATIVYFPKYIGFYPSLFSQLTILCALYVIADWYDKKHNLMTTM